MIVFGLIALVAASMVLLEILASKTKLTPSTLRKISHLGISALVVVVAWLFDYRLLIPVCIIFFGVLLLLRLFWPLRSLNDRPGSSFGVVLFPLGVMLAALISQSSWQLITAVLILGLADTAAYLVGRQIASPVLVFQKTVAGSAAFLLTASLILWLMTPLSVMTAVLGALILTATELASPHGSDNLTVPVMTTVLLVLVF